MPCETCGVCACCTEGADSPGLAGYEPERVRGASGYMWLKPLINGTEAEKLRLELWCMNQRRKWQVEMTANLRNEVDRLSVDVARYQRLRILGCAPMGTPQLEEGTVLRFQGLDAYLDDDLKAVPSRGEYRHGGGDSTS